MITHYYRPAGLDKALALLQEPATRALGGGTTIAAWPLDAPTTVVDLQSLDIARIKGNGAMVRIGAMATLQDLVDSPLVPTAIRDLARREAPNTIRNAATVGGTIGASVPESELLTGLLACGSSVTIAQPGTSSEYPLDTVLEDPGLISGSLITAVSVPSGGRIATDRTARTPMDRPIVAAAAYRSQEGSTRIAVSGISDRPVVVDPNNLADLDPPSDFRGSAAYRSHVAAVLVERVLGALDGGASS
jgi:CO/xanthine dehydrogenase FAD-binding subunit